MRCTVAATVAILVFVPPHLAAQSAQPQSPVEPAAKVEPQSHRGHVGNVRSVAFSPDGRLLATGDDEGSVKLWEVATGLEVRTLEGYPPVRFSPDGQLLATNTWRGRGVQLWDVTTGRRLRSFPTVELDHSFVFSPDGEWIAVGIGSDKVRLFEVKSGKEVRAFAAQCNCEQGVAFSPDGRWLATAGAAGRTAGVAGSSAKVWEVATGNEVRTFRGHKDRVGIENVSLVAFSPDGKWLATVGYDETIKLWELETGREVRTFAGHLTYVKSVVFSPDGRWLASQDVSGRLVVWDVGSGQMAPGFAAVQVPDDWKDRLPGDWGLDFSPDGRWLAAAHKRGVKLLDVTTGNLVRTFHGSPDLGWYRQWRLLRIVSVERSGKPPAGLPKVQGADKGYEYWQVGVELENHDDSAETLSSTEDRIRLCNKKVSCDRHALYERQVGYPLVYLVTSAGMPDLKSLTPALEKEAGKKVIEKLEMSVKAKPHEKINISLVFVAPKNWPLEDTLLYLYGYNFSPLIPLRPTSQE